MLFIPLLKADASQRRLYARLDETVDRGGEAMDYAASKPIFKAWSDMQLAASGGLSRGNVRGQHGRIAAGIVSEITFDDDARAIEFGIDVVDDGEWDKVIKGAYTGISPGGKAARRKDADGTIRYAVTSLNEISLVDVPCLPSATLTLLKADGAQEDVAFVVTPAAPDTDLLKALANAPTLRALGALVVSLDADALEKSLGGSTFGADASVVLFSATARRVMAASGVALADGSFPVTGQADLEAGLTVLEKAAGEFPEARAHLIARAVALDLADILPEGWAPAATDLEKGLGSVSQLASLIQNLTWLAGDVTSEANYEADGSDLPARLCAWIAQGSVILLALAGEETAEAVAGLQAAVATLPVITVVDAGLEKAVGNGFGGEGISVLLKMAGDLAGTRDELLKAHAASASVLAELTALRAQPAPGGIRLRAVGRGEDIAADTTSAADVVAAVEAMPAGRPKAVAMTRLAMSGVLPAPSRDSALR
jgi:hypothetical protein